MSCQAQNPSCGRNTPYSKAAVLKPFADPKADTLQVIILRTFEWLLSQSALSLEAGIGCDQVTAALAFLDGLEGTVLYKVGSFLTLFSVFIY